MVRKDGRTRNARRRVTLRRKQPKSAKLQATMLELSHHPAISPRSETDPSPTSSGESPTIHV